MVRWPVRTDSGVVVFMHAYLKRAAALLVLAAGIGLASAHTSQIVLSGAQEVPAVQTSGRGHATITVTRQRRVSGDVVVHGIRPFMVHIHQGARGTNGPIVIWLKRGADHTWYVPAGSRLTPAQYREYLAGDLYLNVHTHKHPAGAIRGQIEP